MGYNFADGEILLIDKPLEWTSFDVIGAIRPSIRKITQSKTLKIGHAGTLDPMATGLLIICTGPFTKKINEFQDMAKEYTGRIRLGATTPSYDTETEIDQVFPAEDITENEIAFSVKKLIGSYLQVPPNFSAVKIGGKRAYKLARKEKDIEIAPRKVSVFDFDISDFRDNELYFRIVCSKGTYIRSIARDLGIMLGCGGYLTALRRTRIGNFHVNEAIPIVELRANLSGEIKNRL